MRPKKVPVILVVTALLFAPVVGVAGGSVGQFTDSAQRLSDTSSQTVTISENVSVWERLVLPFRLHTNDAAKTMTTGPLFASLKAQNSGSVPANMNKVAVYRNGSTVRATFESVTGAETSSFSGADTQLVVARLEAGHQGGVPFGASMSEVVGLADPSTSTQNATYEVVDTGQVSEDGSLSVEYTFDQPGKYVFFLNAVGAGDGFTATNGSLVANGNNTIIGFDTALVETAPSTSNVPDRVEAGSNVTVDVETPASTPLNHTVVLYERSAFLSSWMTLVVEDELSRNLTAGDLTVRHSIASVNGVMRGEALGANGSTQTAISESKALALITQRVSDNRLNESAVTLRTTGDTVLDASVTSVSAASGPQSLTIRTLENWSNGKYVLFHVAGNSTDVYTDVETVQVHPNTPDKGGNREGAPGNGNGPPSDSNASPGNGNGSPSGAAGTPDNGPQSDDGTDSAGSGTGPSFGEDGGPPPISGLPISPYQ